MTTRHITTLIMAAGIAISANAFTGADTTVSASARRYMTLNDAIALARQQSYDAMVAKLNFMSHYWSYRSFKAELKPAVNLSGRLLQYNHSEVETRNFTDGRISMVNNNSMTNSMSLSIDQNIVALGGTLSVQSYLYRLDQFNYDSKIYNSQPLRLNYTQPLRAFNSLKWRKRSEPMKYEQAKRTYLESMEEVTINVVDLFFNVLAAQSTYQQSVANLSDRRHLFEICKKRLALGTTTKADLLQLELSLLNAEVDVKEKELALKTQKFSLYSYLHIFAYDGIELTAPFAIPSLAINADDVTAKALANSTHSLEQRLSVMEAEKQVAQAKANKGLQVQLSGEVGFSRTANHFSDAYRHMDNNQIVGLTVSLPIFDWGVSKGRVRMAQADLEVTKTQMEQAHERYLQDLQTNVLRFNIQGTQCKNTLRAQEIANERYAITKRQFEAGSVSVTDLNTAQQESENARAQYIAQLQTFWHNYYTLRKATLYDWIGGSDIVTDFDEIIESRHLAN